MSHLSRNPTLGEWIPKFGADPIPRLNVVQNATRAGKVIPFDPALSLSQLRVAIAEQLKMDKVEYLFNTHGCEITDVKLIRDDDVIIASAQPKCQKPAKKKVTETLFSTTLKECLKIVLKFCVQILKKQIAEAAIGA